MAIKTYYLLKRYTDNSEATLPFYVEDVSGQSATLTVSTSYSDVTDIEYSTDNVTWSSTKPTIPANGRVYIRANATYWSTVATLAKNSAKIFSNRNCNLGGNIMSLLYGSNFLLQRVFPNAEQSYVFGSMFRSTGVVSAEKLSMPATTLTSHCYDNMFYQCTSLTTAPSALRATTLASACYAAMFSGCTSLTTAPALPATTLTDNCYSSMFRDCTALTTAPALPATTLVSNCYGAMFWGCTSLTAAPTLPATTLVYNCYQGMFNGCTNLNSITIGATNWDSAWMFGWVNGVSATGTFTKPTNTSIPTGTDGIPSGWTVVNV